MISDQKPAVQERVDLYMSKIGVPRMNSVDHACQTEGNAVP